MKKNEKKEETVSLLLNSQTDYTPKQLRESLNKLFGGKSSGKLFTNQDIFMYTRRGNIPEEYGGQKIKIVSNESIGIKILRIKNV